MLAAGVAGLTPVCCKRLPRRQVDICRNASTPITPDGSQTSFKTDRHVPGSATPARHNRQGLGQSKADVPIQYVAEFHDASFDAQHLHSSSSSVYEQQGSGDLPPRPPIRRPVRQYGDDADARMDWVLRCILGTLASAAVHEWVRLMFGGLSLGGVGCGLWELWLCILGFTFLAACVIEGGAAGAGTMAAPIFIFGASLVASFITYVTAEDPNAEQFRGWISEVCSRGFSRQSVTEASRVAQQHDMLSTSTSLQIGSQTGHRVQIEQSVSGAHPENEDNLTLQFMQGCNEFVQQRAQHMLLSMQNGFEALHSFVSSLGSTHVYGGIAGLLVAAGSVLAGSAHSVRGT